MTSDTTQTSSRTVALPVLPVPSVVLPGMVVTITLDDPAVQGAVAAARNSDGRVLLLADDPADLGVVATVPDTAVLPSGQQAAILRAERRARLVASHTSERGADH